MAELITCNCGNVIPDNDDFCVVCGMHRPTPQENHCDNIDCERFKQRVNDNLQYCGKCGKPTVFGKKIQKYL